MPEIISARDEWARDKHWLEAEVTRLRAALQPFTWQTYAYREVEAQVAKTGDQNVPLTALAPSRCGRRQLKP